MKGISKSFEQSVDTVLLKRLFRYLEPYKWMIFLGIAVLVVSKLLEAWVPLKVGQLVQEIATHVSDPSSYQDLFLNIFQGCLILLFVVLLTYVMNIINILLKNGVSQKAIYQLRRDVYWHIINLPLSVFQEIPVGKLITRTIHEVDQINQLFAESVIPLIGSLALFLGIYIGLFMINWQMAMLITLILPLIWLLTRHFRISQRVSFEKARAVLSSMNGFLQEQLVGIHIIRSFGLQDDEKKRFDQFNENHYQANLETVHNYAFFFSGLEWLQSLIMIVVFFCLVYFTPVGSPFNAGAYFTLILYGMMVFRPLFDLAERYNILQAGMAATSKVLGLIDCPLESANDPKQPFQLNSIESIEFKDVWFAYEDEVWVFKGLSFLINKGESVALVGNTGAGKSTVMNLLLGFYTVQKGEILINGLNILHYTIKDLREQFSVVLQDPVLFSGSIYENIALYDHRITSKMVEDSAHFVHLDSTISHFSDHYQHKLAERGGGLSVGEMQLVGLARAIAHPRSMLIFDEATSNVDIYTEKKIQKTLKKIIDKQTALIIAHRFSTILDVTRILVIHGGVIVENGTHQQLMQFKGIYEKLYRLQTVHSK